MSEIAGRKERQLAAEHFQAAFLPRHPLWISLQLQPISGELWVESGAATNMMEYVGAMRARARCNTLSVCIRFEEFEGVGSSPKVFLINTLLLQTIHE